MKTNKNFSLCIALLTLGVLLGGTAIYKTIIGFKSMQNTNLEQTATYCFETTFSLCGHTDRYVYPKEKPASSLSDVKKAFPEWEISEQDSHVFLRRTVKGYCNLHYYAELTDDKIKISYRDGTPMDEIDTQNLNLSDAEKNWLTQGVYLDGKEALNAFLEDFDS